MQWKQGFAYISVNLLKMVKTNPSACFEMAEIINTALILKLIFVVETLLSQKVNKRIIKNIFIVLE